MIYTEKKLSEIANQMEELINEYSDYYKLRDMLDLDTVNTKIWSKGYIEPFCCDYITDLFDNTVIPRKLMKLPKKKDFVSLHYMCDSVPVYSVYYADVDDISKEKIYINSSEKRIELLFNSKKHILLSIALTLFDSQERPIEYSQISINSKGLKMINNAIYTYEDNYIVKAESIRDFNPEAGIVLFNDEAFDSSLLIQSKIMNPPDVQIINFNYNGNVLQTFTRTDFEYGKTYENTWKKRKTVIKNYIECGIKWFGD